MWTGLRGSQIHPFLLWAPYHAARAGKLPQGLSAAFEQTGKEARSPHTAVIFITSKRHNKTGTVVGLDAT